MLTIPDHAFQEISRNEESETWNARQQEEIVKAGKKYHAGKSQEREQQTRPEVVVNVTGVAQSGLNQPPARARNIGRGERNRFAERIQRLLEAFPEGGLLLKLLRLLAAQSAQTGAQHGSRRHGGGAEGKDHQHDGDEHDDG